MRTILVLSGLLATMGVAAAADPVGEWLVKDKSARIKIVSCPQAQGQTQPPGLWGVMWAEAKPGFDTSSRDPAMKGRPMLGIPILINMRPSGANRWSGKIYDPKGTALISGGGIYDANITLNAKDMLEVRGCFGGIICDGEDWTRITDPNTPPLPPAPPPAPATKGAMAPKKSAAPAPGAAPPVDPICANVANQVPKS
jgi:uncharacterized protein (DUF2147 family)